MATQPVVLVTAATGTQSSSLIRALSSWSSTHSQPLTIHATTRDPSSTGAQSLLTHAHEKCTIKLFAVDFEDLSSLSSPSTAATHAFINVTPVLTDFTAESRQGNNIITALRTHASTTLQRVVYTTATSVLDPSDPSSYAPGTLAPDSWMHIYYSSKYGVEQSTASLAASLSISYTILHPATFLTNLLPPISTFMYPSLSDSARPRITTALRPDFRAAWLDPEDIGGVACLALLLPSDNPLYRERYERKIVPIAQCHATIGQVVEALNRQLERDPVAQEAGVKKVEVEYLGEEAAKGRMEGGDVFVASQVFMNGNQGVFEVDLEAVKGLGLGREMVGMDEFYEREAERVRRAVGLEG